MSDHKEKLIAEDVLHHDIQEYSNTPVPLFLKIVYITLPFWGIWFLISFWNGAHGWTDRGHWHELQIASNTTSIKVEGVQAGEQTGPILRPAVGESTHKGAVSH